jgi:hypothetical protein
MPDSSERSRPPSVKTKSGLTTIQLMTQTIALWARNLKTYIIMVGMVLALLTVLKVAVGFFLFQSLDPSYFADDIGSYLTLITDAALFPDMIGPSYMLRTGISLVFLLLGLVLSAVVTGSAIKFALDDIRGENPRIETSMSSSLNHLTPMIVVQIVISAISGILLTPGLAFMAYGVINDDAMLMVDGLIWFIVLGAVALVIIVRLVTAPVFIIARDKSVNDSLNNSFELTRGQFWHVCFGWVLVTLFVIFVDFLISAFIPSLFSTLIDNLLLGPVMYIFYTVVYADLVLRPGVAEQEWW